MADGCRGRVQNAETVPTAYSYPILRDGTQLPHVTGSAVAEQCGDFIPFTVKGLSVSKKGR